MSAQVIPFPRAMAPIESCAAHPELVRLAELIAERVRGDRDCSTAEAMSAARAAMKAR